MTPLRYSLELFDTLRKVKKVGTWTVGLSGGLIHEGTVHINGSISKYVYVYARVCVPLSECWQIRC